jgi:hypothetical protein
MGKSRRRAVEGVGAAGKRKSLVGGWGGRVAARGIESER